MRKRSFRWSLATGAALLLGAAIGPAPSMASSLEWSGYFSVHYEKEVFEDEGHLPGSFDAFSLALIPRVDITPRLNLYAQIVFEHGGYFEFNHSCRPNPDGADCAQTNNARNSGELTLNDVYVGYEFGERAKVRAGKFATPFGFWNTLMYAAPTHVTLRQPGRESLYARTSKRTENSVLFGRYGMGVWLLGQWAPLSYDLYVVNGRTRLDDHKDDSENKAVGGRLGTILPLGPSHLSLLYSRYQDRVAQDYPEAGPFVRQATNAVSAELKWDEFVLISEGAMSKRGDVKMNGYYAIAHYTLLERWTPFIQYERFEPNKEVKGDRLTTVSVGTVFHVVPWQSMVKIQADQIDREDPPGSKREDSRKYWVGFATAF